MAKQSFSVGQVLTANQMLSLQQTAMLGGSATAKTASYTLVAADAGTVVSVNSTSATTITVNTGLFSAGDTVTIQNWGSGLVTITAGTATVNTAGSLIVPQYDGGVLYFTSASAAIYFDFVQAGSVSPLTTKGDLYTFGSSDTRIGVGANDTVLIADSSTATGLKWGTPSSGGMTLLSTTALTGATNVVVTGISGSYVNLVGFIVGLKSTSADVLQLKPNFNGATGGVTCTTLLNLSKGGTVQTSEAIDSNAYQLTSNNGYLKHTNANNISQFTIYFYADATALKNITSTTCGVATDDAFLAVDSIGYTRDTPIPITDIAIKQGGGTLNGGTLYLYGVK